MGDIVDVAHDENLGVAVANNLEPCTQYASAPIEDGWGLSRPK